MENPKPNFYALKIRLNIASQTQLFCKSQVLSNKRQWRKKLIMAVNLYLNSCLAKIFSSYNNNLNIYNLESLFLVTNAEFIIHIHTIVKAICTERPFLKI